MREKGIATAVMAAVIVVILVVAGLGAYFLLKEEGGPGEGDGGVDGISVPAGFSKTAEGPEDGYTVTTYAGPGTAEDAASSFTTALQDAGWTYTGVTEEFPISQYIGGTGFEKGNEVAVVVAMEEAGQVTVHVVIGSKPGEGEDEALTLNAGGTTENSTMLSWSQSTAADFVSYVIYQSTLSGVLGDQIATETDATKTYLRVTGLSTNTTYYFTARVNLADGIYEDSNQVSVKTLQEGEEPALVPTNYQTTFPAPTDVFIVPCPSWPPDEEFISQTHATIIGVCGTQLAESDPDLEEDHSHTITTYHNLGLKWTVWLSTHDIEGVESQSDEEFYQDRPELIDTTCIDIDGEKVTFELTGLYFHCTNNPVWRDFLLETAKRSIRCGADGIAFDEWPGTYSAVRNRGGCFCEYCMQGFREYLKEKYSDEELGNFGIENIDNFDYGDFIRDHTGGGNVQIHSDFDDYQMASIRGFWHEFIGEIRAYAAAQGKDVYFSANTAELYPHIIPIQNELDYLSPEFTYGLPPQGRSIAASKLVRSLGKPAFFCPICTGITAEIMTRPDVTTLMKIYTAEAYSARGFLIVPYNIHVFNPEGGGAEYSADIEELSPYYDFIYNNEQCYANLFSTSKIAVLYSYSSARHAYDTTTNDFYDISDLLLDSHFQYDVLFAGDDDWIEDNLSLSQLNEYEVVILPNTSHLSDIQVSLLLSYAESGGNIFAFGEIGSRDEEGQQVERTLLRSLFVEGSHDFGLGKFIYSTYFPTREGASGILSGLIQPCIQTNANENVVMLEYWNNETHSIVIHLINYAYDIETEHLSPQQNINLEVVLDPELLGKDLSISYMSPDWTGIEELSYTLSDGSVEFQVPNLEFYGVVSIGEASD